MPEVLKRIENVKTFRQASRAPSTNLHAIRPSEFRDTALSKNYIIIPRVSSERRTYIPLAFEDNSAIPNDRCQVIANASLYSFGIITSNMHMAWMRVVAGRLKSDYTYSKDIVYNNFIWPQINDIQKSEIERLAQSVLDARNEYPNATLADLYDPLTMPPSLRSAHKNLDRAVDKLYGISSSAPDTERVAKLFELYKDKTK